MSDVSEKNVITLQCNDSNIATGAGLFNEQMHIAPPKFLRKSSIYSLQV